MFVAVLFEPFSTKLCAEVHPQFASLLLSGAPNAVKENTRGKTPLCSFEFSWLSWLKSPPAFVCSPQCMFDACQRVAK